MTLQIATRKHMMNMSLAFMEVAHRDISRKEAFILSFYLACKKDVEIWTTRHRSVHLLRQTHIPKGIRELRLFNCVKIRTCTLSIDVPNIDPKSGLRGHLCIFPSGLT